MPGLTIHDLEYLLLQGCDGEGCNHNHDELFFHGKCHPRGQIGVSYRKGGTMRVGCRECGAVIVEVAVSREPEG